MSTPPFPNLQFVPVTTPDQIAIVCKLATIIWRDCFPRIIGPRQVESMLEAWQSPSAVTSQIESGTGYILVKWQAEAVGYCAWTNQPDKTTKLSKFYLCPQQQGKGFASAMMQHIETAARQAGATKIWLQVNRHNYRAIHFYHKAGFSIVRDQFQQVVPGCCIDDHIMEKHLDN